MNEYDIYNKWASNELEQKCNDCDFKGYISDLDRITCSKYCGYAAYECDNCGFSNRNTIIDNKLDRIQLTNHIKYCLYDTNQCISIWICNECKKDDDEKKIIEQINNLFNSNFNTNCSIYYDMIGNQIQPQLKENDSEYLIKKMFNVNIS